MPFFQYKAVSPTGEVQEGVLEASSTNTAVARLQEMGFIPIRAEEAGGAKVAVAGSAQQHTDAKVVAVEDHIGQHRQTHDREEGQRQPAALGYLEQVREQHRHVDKAEHTEYGDRQLEAPVPLPRGNQRDVERIDHHDARHRDTVGGGQRAGAVEDQYNQNNADQQAGIHSRHVNLPEIAHRGMPDFHAWKLAQLHRLAR